MIDGLWLDGAQWRPPTVPWKRGGANASDSNNAAQNRGEWSQWREGAHLLANLHGGILWAFKRHFALKKEDLF